MSWLGAYVLANGSVIAALALSLFTLFDEVRERAADHGGEVRTVTEVGKPSRIIPEYAEEHDVDLIVMGCHGRSLLS